MRMRWMMVVVVLAPALLSADTGDEAQGPLSDLGFLRGCWRGSVSDSVAIEETWTAADADAMLATTRYLRDGHVVGWEFSRIHADSSGIHLTPYPDGQARDPFTLDRADGRIAIFVNDRNDFPQTILYRGDGERELLVRLEGSGRTMEWRMRAGACAS